MGSNGARVVALFSFGGSLAVACIEKEMPLLVDQIVDWVQNYVDTKLSFVDNAARRMGEYSYSIIIKLLIYDLSIVRPIFFSPQSNWKMSWKIL